MIVILNNGGFDNDLLIEAVSFVLPSGLNRFTIEFSDTWFYETEEGARVYKDNHEWDGTAWLSPRYEVWVVLSPWVEFPIAWWVNEQLVGNYVRGMILRDTAEYLVYATAHELRHLYQSRFPRAKRIGAEFGGDDETDSDIYAILKLRQWRETH